MGKDVDRSGLGRRLQLQVNLGYAPRVCMNSVQNNVWLRDYPLIGRKIWSAIGGCVKESCHEK
uniref:Uncharacterized protein n=1 Tax=Candidatus Nitrotoga fabula TaxID=2182327 RepID=A0A2X0SKR2_9PROT|nr:protein of unknown function [Candidatus Nitrotoga fabula]